MLFSSLLPVVFSLSLALAHSKTSLRSRRWNTTTIEPTPTSSDYIAITESPSLELAATIQIQIDNLSGSGVISLSSIGPPIQTSSTGGLPRQTKITFTSCPNTSMSNTTTTPPGPTLNSNISKGYAIPQPSAAPTPTTTLANLGLFTGSAIKNRQLPHMPALLSSILAWLI
ncbi:hypothetical protein F5884DRAFT_112831 [Xylogone sp. PMI_703]|nr:hypothetical protein F5884DRAFT_112831 [Xylogone sp. PMI_703]